MWEWSRGLLGRLRGINYWRPVTSMKDDWADWRRDWIEGHVLDFGSFSGCRIGAVPHDYLLWCLKAVSSYAGRSFAS